MSVAWVEAGAGPAVCATHPFASLAVAAPLLAEAAGARVVCVDPRPEGSTLDELVDDLESVRRGLGVKRWIMWGMSGGSMAAQVYAHRHPEALAGLILASAGPCFRDVLADPACIMSPANPAWGDALSGMTGADDGPFEWQHLGPAAVWRVRGGRPRLVSPGSTTAQMKRSLPDLWSFDARPWLGEIRVPVLVMGGTADPVAPIAHVRRLAAAVRGASLIELEGAGHDLLTERPAEVAAAVAAFVRSI